MCSTLAIAETSDGTSTNTNYSSDNISIVVRPQIAGLWGMEIPNNKKCVEYYNFKLGNQVIVKSADEWSTGAYEYQPSPDDKLLGALTMQIKFDNNEKDCSGRKDDQTGEVSQYFVKWQNENTIQFCTAEKASKCFVTLRRVLP